MADIAVVVVGFFITEMAAGKKVRSKIKQNNVSAKAEVCFYTQPGTAKLPARGDGELCRGCGKLKVKN